MVSKKKEGEERKEGGKKGGKERGVAKKEGEKERRTEKEGKGRKKKKERRWLEKVSGAHRMHKIRFPKEALHIIPRISKTSQLCKTVQEPTTSRQHVIAVTPEPFEFQSKNVPRFRLLEGQDCRGAFACVIKTQKTFFDDLDVNRRLPLGNRTLDSIDSLN